MFALAKVLQALRRDRIRFGEAFLQAQADIGWSATERKELGAIAPADEDPFDAGLRYAQANKFFDLLVDLIVERRLDDGTLTGQLVEEGAGTGDAALQSVTNVALGFEEPSVVWNGVKNAMQWTAKIVIDGQPQGTGILIRPHLVLTAWHVVRPLFEPAPGGGWRETPGGADRIEIYFDDFLRLIGRHGREPLKVRAHKEWLVTFSACHQEELDDELPTDLSVLKDYWDYAVIRLAASLGRRRQSAQFDGRCVVPRSAERLVVFQHAAGQPLKMASDVIAPLDPATQAAVPAYRFLHYANTKGGSSGGPCFDKSFSFFGFHQGVWKAAPEAEGRVTNRGVPIVGVDEHLRTSNVELPSPPADPIWRLDQTGNYAPAIGTDAFQAVVWRSVAEGDPRILVVTGPARSGKTFHVDVLWSMLPVAGHLKVRLEAQVISKMVAVDLAARICTEAGAVAPHLRSAADINSTAAVWLKEEVLAKVLAALDEARQGRFAWLAITDLNTFEIDSPEASQLLLLLYEQTLTTPWLRIVLDGMRGDLPLTLDPPHSEQYRTVAPTAQSIAAYFAELDAEFKLEIGDVAVKAKGLDLFDRYQDALNEDAARAMEKLVRDIRRAGNQFLAAAGPPDGGP